MEVYGALFWVGNGGCINILDGWRWIGKYFDWVGGGWGMGVVEWGVGALFDNAHK